MSESNSAKVNNWKVRYTQVSTYVYNFFLFNVLIVLLEQLTGDLIVFTQYCYVYDTCSDWLKVNNDNNGKVECFQKVNIDLSSLEGVDVEKKNHTFE